MYLRVLSECLTIIEIYIIYIIVNELIKNMINLVVVAHPDDEVLGFGGTGAKLVKQGEIVQPIILCGNVKARYKRSKAKDLYEDMISANRYLGFNVPVLGKFPNLRINTIDHIDVVNFIEKQILKFKPNRIFTHHPSDLNNDHVQISNACLAASRLFQRRLKVSPIEAIYFMEILSSTDWSFSAARDVFKPDTFSDIAETLNVKLKALSKYKDVMRAQPHPRSKEVLTGHAAYRGGQCSHLYAEAFQTVFRREI